MVMGQQGRQDASVELAQRMSGKKASGGAGGPRDPLDELEATIAKVENIQARELLQASANRLKAKMELEEKQTRAQIRRIEDGKEEPRDPVESAEDREMTKANITANALLLLEKGVPANVVGQYLLGSQTSNIPINFGGGGGPQGLTMSDVVQIFTLAKGEKGTDPELKLILAALTDKVKTIETALANVGHQEAKKAWVIHPDGTKEEIQPGEPIVIKPLVQATGENIELLKEQNRHAEEVEKIKGDKDYKEKVANTLASLPERIGAGLASNLVDAEQPPPSAAKKTSEGIAYLKCESENCGYNIPYPLTSTKVVCPKCRAIYERTPDTKKPEGGNHQ